MRPQCQHKPHYCHLLIAGVIVLQSTFLPAQAPSAILRQSSGQGSGQAITIAVLDFDGFGISQTEAIALSNRLRNELFRLGTFEVVDRGMMENILAEQDFQQAGCTSNDCLVEVGRLLGAQRMVGGSISKVGQTFSVSARLVDVETGKVLSVSDFDQRGEIDDMLTRGMKEVASMLSSREVSDQETLAQATMRPQAKPSMTRPQVAEPIRAMRSSSLEKVVGGAALAFALIMLFFAL